MRISMPHGAHCVPEAPTTTQLHESTLRVCINMPRLHETLGIVPVMCILQRTTAMLLALL